MNKGDLQQKCETYLHMLCDEISERSVGSEGNRKATGYLESVFRSSGWITNSHEFDAMDWNDGGASLVCDNQEYKVMASPYANGCEVTARLVSASTYQELLNIEMGGSIVLLRGDLAREQLMPKNFVFYNPIEHQQIISALEQGKPAAVVCATERNPALAGGVYPFPLIEDGDFDIPSVYMTDEDGLLLLSKVGHIASIISRSQRISGTGYNVIATRGEQNHQRIVVTAHVDAKKGTPGAIDNGTGVVVLLLLSELLADYRGSAVIELVALNGEDYYAVPGQMLYIAQNQERFSEIKLNINIDGAGYKDGNSAWSFYDLPEKIQTSVLGVLDRYPGIDQGPQWPQGDHSIFVQYGCPAIAVSSAWFTENIDSQEITHTPKDNVAIVDCTKVVEIAQALNALIMCHAEYL